MASETATEPVAVPCQPPRLLDQLRDEAAKRFGRSEPGERYVMWSRRYVLFHGKRHPLDLGLADAGRFLQYLAQCEVVAGVVLDPCESPDENPTLSACVEAFGRRRARRGRVRPRPRPF